MLRDGEVPEGRAEAAELQETADGVGHTLARLHRPFAFLEGGGGRANPGLPVTLQYGVRVLAVLCRCRQKGADR